MAVKVGVGVIIANPQGQVLLGKRCGSHAPFWSIPAGMLRKAKLSSKQRFAKLKKKRALLLPNRV